MADLHCFSNCRGTLKANVIFFHGLGGHPRFTWQANKLDESTLWPRWLAEDIEGHAIWSVGYESPVSRWEGYAMGLYDRAENVLGRLIKEPRLGEGRIILLGHSLGGLVIKQLLEILGQEANKSTAAASLLERIDKVAFLATPHSGADLAIWGDRLRILVRPSAATRCLVRNDENLRRLNNWYRDWATSIGISHLVLRETKPIRILGTIVKPDTADPALHRVRAWPTDHDHWSIAKPKSRSDDVYVHVKQFVLDQFERPKPRVEKLAEELLSRQQATNSDTRDILSLLKRSEQGADISIAVGKDTFEIVLPNSDELSSASDLELPWQPLATAVQPGDYNLLDALRWNYGLIENLYGRDEELTKIIGWAERAPAPPSARLVTGEGGSGKTRLAATVANALRKRGWIAGFVRSISSLRVTIGDANGLFLILDYPEENLDLMRALIKMLVVTKSASYPIRLLLLSRRDFRHWEAENIDLEGRFGNQPIADPGDLSLSDVLELIETAATNFAAAAGLPKPRLDQAEAWAMQASLHRLPLFAAAAAIHAVLAPRNAFGIDGNAIVRDLAMRERARVRRTSKQLGIGPDTLGRLTALGVLGDGLNVDVVGKLIDAGLCEDVARDQVIQKIANTPWWRLGQLTPIKPDRMAAEFLGAELFDAKFPDGDPRLSRWLSIAFTGAEEGLGNRLGRVLFDMDALDVAGSRAQSLERRLAEIIELDPMQAVRFVAVATQDVPYAAVGFAALVALTMARLLENEPARRAGFLNNATSFLSRLGQHEKALAAAREAVAVYRDLARAQPEAFTSGMAGALNNLANVLAELGQREEALAVARETAAIRRGLAKARPEASTLDLAGTLNNLANRLFGLGHREEALATAREATGIYRDLARARPDEFRPELAMSLNNLANMLSELGERGEALGAAREATGINRDLARARPEAFTPDLAMSLNNLANRLSERGQHEEALAAAREATGIYRNLARARPEAFTPDLAMSLNNLANVLAELGQHEEALAAAREAIAIHRELTRARPEAFTPDLAMSLNNVANVFAELGQREEALAASREAVAIRRDLARARPEAFTPNLATSLSNQANILSELGQREEALAAAREAVAIRRDLVRARPEAFAPNLAASLNNLVNILSKLGQREEALDAAREATGFYRDLARAQPEAFTHYLATSLKNLAAILSELQQFPEAAIAEQEAKSLSATRADIARND